MTVLKLVLYEIWKKSLVWAFQFKGLKILILLTKMKLFERTACLGGRERISPLDVHASVCPLCGLCKRLRTATGTKAVAYEWSLTFGSNQKKKIKAITVADLVNLLNQSCRYQNRYVSFHRVKQQRKECVMLDRDRVTHCWLPKRKDGAGQARKFCLR